jgi:hypothetical protein
MPLLSVVVPLYQKEPWIGRCLDSVSAQTLEDHEVVVVDDGSTDGGGDVVRARRDPRVRLVTQDNAGEGAARNRGVAEARAPWIALLDADDEWRPGFLSSTLAVAAAQPGLAAVFTNVTDADTGARLLPASGAGSVADYFAFALANRGVGMTASSTLVRREALAACGGFRVGVEVGADNDAWARLAWSGPLAYVSEPLAVYHATIPESATWRARRGVPAFPATVESFRAWQAAGRIPASLCASSRRFVNGLLLDHAAALCNTRHTREARAVLRDPLVQPALEPMRYAAVALRARLPHDLHLGLRRWLGRGEPWMAG